MDELQACVLPAVAVDVDGEAEAAVSPSALACVRVMANVLQSDLSCHSNGSIVQRKRTHTHKPSADFLFGSKVVQKLLQPSCALISHFTREVYVGLIRFVPVLHHEQVFWQLSYHRCMA